MDPFVGVVGLRGLASGSRGRFLVEEGGSAWGDSRGGGVGSRATARLFLPISGNEGEESRTRTSEVE